MCTVKWLSPSTNHRHSASSIPHFIFRIPHFIDILSLSRGNASIFKFHYPVATLVARDTPHNFSTVIFICTMKTITTHVNAYPGYTKNALKRTSEFDGYVLEYKALLISIGTRILEASQQKLPRNFVNLIIRNV